MMNKKPTVNKTTYIQDEEQYIEIYHAFKIWDNP